MFINQTFKRCLQTNQQQKTTRRFHASIIQHKDAPLTDYSSFITPLSARRQPSAIRSLMPLLKIPGMISLGGGLPNSDMFPFEELSFKVKSGPTLTLTSAELTEALQYSPTPGLPKLVQLLKDLQISEHKPVYNDWDISITNGSQEALTLAFAMLLDENRSVIVEDPTYSGALAFLQPLGCKILGVPTDEYGIIPDQLRHYLTHLPHNVPKPKVIYTIPTGQNPSGSTATTQRKAQIYEIACEHNLIILEDDPYYYLAFGKDKAPNDDAMFQRSKINSYFSMDTQKRVLRFDSLSKVLSSGARIGTVTGPAPLIQRINFHTQATTLHASGLSQMMMLKLFNHWGENGFQNHVKNCALFYLKRRDLFHQAALKHLTPFATWSIPTAGMFMWFKCNNIKNTKAMIEQKAVDAKVLLVPGQAFSPSNTESPYVRAAFSTASYSEMDTALSRFATLLKQAS